MLFGMIKGALRGPVKDKTEKGLREGEADSATPAEAAQGPAQHVARVQLTSDGEMREFATSVDLDDIGRNGVAWSQPMRKPYSGKAGGMERLATLLNIASVCRDHGKMRDELAALRMATRMTGGRFDLVNQRVAQCAVAHAPAQAANGALAIVSFEAERERFEDLIGSTAISNNFHHPGAEFLGLKGIGGRLLLPPDPSVDNVSFAICRGATRLAVVPCVIQRDDTISWVASFLPSGGIPIVIHFDEAAREHDAILDVVMRHLNELLMSFGAKQVVIREPFPERMLLYRTLGLSGTFSAEIWDRPVVQLANRSEEHIFAKVRNSYKSHINWGRSNLAMEYLSGDHLTEATVGRVYRTIQDCHQELIQRYGDGMSQEMFRAPISICQMGRGEVAIATTRSGTVCGITVVTDEGGISHYALGGSVPQQNKSPGQFIVYDSILRAKARGSLRYHVNREYAAPVSIDQLQTKVLSRHDTNLTFFKRGFSDQVETMNVYKVLPGGLGFLGR